MARKADLTHTATDAIILKLLSENQMYGYEIIKKVDERTQGAFQWKEGTLYPCLHRLEAEGLIESFWSTDTPKPRKYYALTRQGKSAVTVRVHAVQSELNHIHALLGFGTC